MLGEWSMCRAPTAVVTTLHRRQMEDNGLIALTRWLTFCLVSIHKCQDCRAARCTGCKLTSLQGQAAIEARPVIVVTLTNDFTTTDNDGAMAVLHLSRLGGLLEAKR